MVLADKAASSQHPRSPAPRRRGVEALRFLSDGEKGPVTALALTAEYAHALKPFENAYRARRSV